MLGLAIGGWYLWKFSRDVRTADGVWMSKWAARLLWAAMPVVVVLGLYLGVHYLSDVAAAFLEGIAWLVLCLIAAERLPPHRLAKSRCGSA